MPKTSAKVWPQIGQTVIGVEYIISGNSLKSEFSFVRQSYSVSTVSLAFFFLEVSFRSAMRSRSGAFLLWEPIHLLLEGHSGTVLKFGIKNQFSMVRMSPCH